jgi:uncharacterized protein YdaU (DUF1376 family)
MSKEQAPAFQFYAAEYLADENVQLMSLEEEGCYIRLMAYCWREGSVPSDEELLTRLCKGVKPSRVVKGCFNYPSNDSARLLHPRLEVERQKHEEWRSKCARGGKASARKRKYKNNVVAQQGSCLLVPSKGQVKGNTSSSTSSSNNTLSKRGSRFVPEEFQITAALMEWARKERPDLNLDVEVEKFRDYEFARAYTDWERVFKNWIRNAKGQSFQKAAQKSFKPDLVGQSQETGSLSAEAIEQHRRLRPDLFNDPLEG